jgi:hypothetical protein
LPTFTIGQLSRTAVAFSVRTPWFSSLSMCVSLVISTGGWPDAYVAQDRARLGNPRAEKPLVRPDRELLAVRFERFESAA